MFIYLNYSKIQILKIKIFKIWESNGCGIFLSSSQIWISRGLFEVQFLQCRLSLLEAVTLFHMTWDCWSWIKLCYVGLQKCKFWPNWEVPMRTCNCDSTVCHFKAFPCWNDRIETMNYNISNSKYVVHFEYHILIGGKSLIKLLRIS